MNVMIKFNRAFRKGKSVFIDLNEGQKKILQRDISFSHNGKRFPLTLKVQLDKAIKIDPEVTVILWDNKFRMSGKEFYLSEMTKYIDEFNSSDTLFNNELNNMFQKLNRKSSDLTLEKNSSSLLDRYPDE